VCGAFSAASVAGKCLNSSLKVFFHSSFKFFAVFERRFVCEAFSAAPVAGKFLNSALVEP
jgi:hypothetical protein